MSQVHFFFDFASPYAYFASTQIEALCNKYEAQLIWSPMVLGAVFKAVEMDNVPILAMAPAKRKHYQADMHRFAEYYDLQLKWPSRFPLRTINPLRLVLVAQKEQPDLLPALVHRVFKAAWVEDADVADADNLKRYCEEVGAPAGWVEQTQDPEIKKGLFAATDVAIDAGVFGAPSFWLNQKDLYWGQDRLPLLEFGLSKAAS